MFENMSGFVGYAMHDDVLLRSRKNIHAAEADRMLHERQRTAARQPYREVIAKALIALAARLSPTLREQTVSTMPVTAAQ